MAPLREVSMTQLLDRSIDQQEKYRMLDRKITQEHFKHAIKKVKKSVGDTKKFEDWNSISNMVLGNINISMMTIATSFLSDVQCRNVD